jgi:anti-sigma B factor antagonist
VSLSLAHGSAGGSPVLALTGQLDFGSATVLRQAVDGLVRPADPGLVLDLTAVDFVDSAGLHLLVQLADALVAHRQQLRLVLGPESPVRRVVHIAGLDAVLPLDVDVSTAANALRPPR